MWSAIDRTISAIHAPTGLVLVNGHGLVDQDDEARAVVRYSTPGLHDRSFDPAWCFYPDLMVLAAIDTYRRVFDTDPGAAWQGCRDVALTSGPWWPFPETVVMSERPTLLTLDEQDRLHADGGPAIQWRDGHHMWAHDGVLIGPPRSWSATRGA
ncbi:DUF6745 domain-containing protein [Micromonospora sp. NBC_00860]|uniref:DUF6745 domain-containing protein n=1 Tax=Micromonospora sp. NBC_00860 TaxID=2975980 RepID=UPI00386908DC|nr:hypothetical protein OH804_04470 [Micromonospora sp. NBC_00860]